jgi:peptidoglycan/xylan/chitin deacetylase (PgdA/CDA1 family)
MALLALGAGTGAADGDAGVSLPVIMYHSVCNVSEGRYIVPPALLENDLKYLVKTGYLPVTFSQVRDYVAGRGVLPRKPVMLTFDDGHYNFYDTVAPLLQKYGFSATVSVVKAYAVKEDREEKRSVCYSYMNAAEIGELVKNPRIEVQNHSDKLHTGAGAVKRRGESSARYIQRIKADILSCDAYLREAGATPSVFVLPFGKFSKDTALAVKAAGYQGMMTCEEKSNTLKIGDTQGLFRLKRYNRPGGKGAARYFQEIKVT